MCVQYHGGGVQYTSYRVNLPPCYSVCIRYFTTSSRLIFCKLGSFLRGLTVLHSVISDSDNQIIIIIGCPDIVNKIESVSSSMQ